MDGLLSVTECSTIAKFLRGSPSGLSSYVGVPKHHLDDDATRDDATRGDVLASRRGPYRCRHVVVS